jgi:hypothetical protein
MTDKSVWFGAGRGMGVDVRAALDASHSVVATGRNPDAVAGAIGAGTSDDITSRIIELSEATAAPAPEAIAASASGACRALARLREELA